MKLCTLFSQTISRLYTII